MITVLLDNGKFVEAPQAVVEKPLDEPRLLLDNTSTNAGTEFSIVYYYILTYQLSSDLC
jgi:hypothetical protein